MKNQAIGIIDSGLGGLAVVQELKRQLPDERLIYFSDMQHYPYEIRSIGKVTENMRRSLELLAEKNVKLIINACGYMGADLPEKEFSGIPCVGLCMPAAQAACSLTKNGRIGIIGSAQAVHSGVFSKAIKTIHPGTSVAGSGSPLLIPAVTEDYLHKDPVLLTQIIKECTDPVTESGADTIITCSPYCDFITELIAAEAGDGVKLVSPVREAVKAAELILFERDLLADGSENADTVYLVNGSSEYFAGRAAKLCGADFSGKNVMLTDV